MRKRYKISEEYKLLSGKYIVPQDVEIPNRFWGLIVLNSEIDWEE